MTTNKPEVKRYDCTSGRAMYCYGCYTMEVDEMGDYVEWEAYEALQAKCEKLRKDAERYRWLRDANINTLPYDDHGIGPEFPWGDDLDAAIDAAMEKENHPIDREVQ